MEPLLHTCHPEQLLRRIFHSVRKILRLRLRMTTLILSIFCEDLSLNTQDSSASPQNDIHHVILSIVCEGSFTQHTRFFGFASE